MAESSKTHVHQYDSVTHHCKCGAYRFQGFKDHARPKPRRRRTVKSWNDWYAQYGGTDRDRD